MSESESTKTDYNIDPGFPQTKPLSGRIWSPRGVKFLLIACGSAYWIGWVFTPVWGSLQSSSAAALLLPLSIGVGLIATGLAIGTVWQSFAALFSLTFVGQAASLQMIDAGKLIHFQHYRSFTELLSDHTLALFVVGVQTLVIAGMLLSRLRPAASWVRGNFRGWQLAVIAVFLLLAGAAVTPDLAVYTNSIFLSGWFQLLSLISLIPVVASVPAKSAEKLKSFLDEWLTDDAAGGAVKLDRFSILAALWVVVLSSSLAYLVYQAHPHVPDETQYVFQARYMAAGQLTVTPPPVPEAFSMYMVPFRDERWYGIFPPGWPALLAVGELAGLIWLVNPLMAGVCVLLTYLLFQQLYGRGFARAGVVLLCCSPWFIFMSMSLMSHVATLTFALAAAVTLASGRRSRSHVTLFLSGTMVGVLSLIRPLDAAIVGALLGIWIVMDRVSLKFRLTSAPAFAAGMFTSASVILPYNRIVTGQALLMPIDAYYNNYFWPKVMGLGFGPERGMGWEMDAYPGHSPLEAMINASLNVFQLNTELFGWGMGSLILILVLFVSGTVSRKDLWAWATILAVGGVYGLYWYHGGPDFGARYWFLALIPLIALSLRGAAHISRRMGSAEHSSSIFDFRVVLAVAVLCVMGVTAYIPWRSADKYYNYLGMNPSIWDLAQQNNFGRSLVLIRGNEHPDYQSGWIFNPLNFKGDGPIYAYDRSPEIRTELLRTYGDRQVWIVDGPSIADGQYRVHQGPIDADLMLDGSSR